MIGSRTKIMRCFYLCIVVFLCAVRSCGGLQAAGDYDVYSSYNYDDDEDATKNAPIRSSIPIGDVLKKLGILGAVGGGAYAGFHGFKLARKVLGKLYDERKERKANAAAEAAEAASIAKPNVDMEKMDRSSSKGTKSLSSSSSSSSTDVMVHAGYDTTALDEMKKEQEELWRFLHSLFKNQDEIIAKLDKLPKESLVGTTSDDSNIPDSTFRDFSQKVESSLTLLSARLDSLDNKLTSVEDSINTYSQAQHTLPSTLDKMKDVLTSDEVKQLIKHETRELNDALLAVRNDVKLQMIKYLKEHDEVVVEKIKSFGEDMKKIVKGSTMTTSKSSSSGGSKPPRT